MKHILKGLIAGVCLAGAAPAARAVDLPTYHYDTLRTGWNSSETILTPAKVGGSTFGLLSQVAVDEQVDAQPLFLSAVTINRAQHDVLYVATENNSVYAIDANSLAVLASTNLGPAVPTSALPGGCNNSSSNIGINSTPVIDRTAGAIYVMAYTYDNGTTPTFRLHKLDLTTLQDKMPPVIPGGGSNLHNGKPLAFVSANNRQRSALLEANGNIYAGFASWCDINANVSRGWVLGWNATTLAQLPADALLNQRAHSAYTFFLSSVWMSGYGIASDSSGDLFFVTGNSDPAGKSYSKSFNLAESVVRLSSDLTTVHSFYTPNTWPSLDSEDADFGAAGVLLLPDQPGNYPHLAVAAGKVGPMVLLNRDNLGGVGGIHVPLGTYANGGCWCGESYFQGTDGIGRVVTSTGYNVSVWKVQTSGKKPALVAESTSPGLNGFQDPGFFTSISSNGTAANSQVVWAVERPSNPNTNTVSLKAFDPSNGSAQLFAAVAGAWPYACCGNANLVPVVANGHVFVASYGVVTQFGLATAHRSFHAPLTQAVFALPSGIPHQVTGTVTEIGPDAITIKLRNGQRLHVDIASAMAASHVAPPSIGHASLIRGKYATGGFTAAIVLHQKDNPLSWLPDR